MVPMSRSWPIDSAGAGGARGGVGEKGEGGATGPGKRKTGGGDEHKDRGRGSVRAKKTNQVEITEFSNPIAVKMTPATQLLRREPTF